MPKLSGNGRSFLPKVFNGNFSHLSSPLFKRQIVDKVGLFDNEMSAVADYHFLLRCVIAEANFYYHDTQGTYSLVRWHPGNMSKDPSFMRSEEIKMRQSLTPDIEQTGNKAAIEANRNAIKALSIMTRKTWRKKFLSGGPFDFIKKGLRIIGLEKMARKIFYK
jgi:hypothetical protein